MNKLRLIGLATGVGLAFAFANAGTASAQDITIGVAGPMTGQYATFGTQLKNGAELAVADINAAGGVLGKKLKLDVGDDACDPKQAHAVAEKLVGMKVPFVAGHFCSGSSIPASDVYAEAGIMQISPASTNPKFTDARHVEHVPRLRPRRPARRGRRQVHRRSTSRARTSPSSTTRSTYGKGLADETKKAMNKAGMKEKHV